MKKLVYLLLFAGTLISCKNKKQANEFLLPSNINSQFFTVDPEKDTIIHTSHAAVLQIRKGTFNNRKPVTIEIKEVYTPDEIFMAGLTTTSDGKPLRSAGMLYFNASVDGSSIKPLMPIETTIPAKDQDPEMQLFKGEIQKDSTIDWVDPEIIRDTISPKDLEHRISYGKQLFMSKCASCHRIFTQGTGPALKDLQYRGPWKNPRNILSWVNNSRRFMASDKYTRELNDRYYGMMMPLFPDITAPDIADILAYINNAKSDEPVTKPVASSKPDTLTTTDCGTDTLYYSERNDFAEYDTTFYPEVFPDTAIKPFNPYDPVYRDIYQEGYEFEIKDNGWYNIDAFLKENSEGIENVELIADLRTEGSVFMNVYLFIPTERVMQSTTDKKGNQYHFDFENGTIPLPLRERAVLFVFGSVKDKILYGVSEFTIEKKQVVPVEIRETTKEGLKNIIFSKNLNGIELNAVEKKMEIQKIPCEGVTPEFDKTSPAKDSTARRRTTNK